MNEFDEMNNIEDTMVDEEVKGQKYFDKFEDVLDEYLPVSGEGEDIASQIVTAVNKIVYMWYSDGDVYDNTYSLKGWMNDISSYANWLYKNVPASKPILVKIEDSYTDDDYEEILKALADKLLDKDFLAEKKNELKSGTIYECNGPFIYESYSDEDDEDYSEDDDYVDMELEEPEDEPEEELEESYDDLYDIEGKAAKKQRTENVVEEFENFLAETDADYVNVDTEENKDAVRAYLEDKGYHVDVTENDNENYKYRLTWYE